MENPLASPITLLALVFGMVEFLKKVEIKGRALTVSSLILGILGGIAQTMYAKGVPATLQEWLAAGAIGLSVGLASCGVYDFLASRLPKQTDG